MHSFYESNLYALIASKNQSNDKLNPNFNILLANAYTMHSSNKKLRIQKKYTKDGSYKDLFEKTFYLFQKADKIAHKDACL